jgi:hypothetical protein
MALSDLSGEQIAQHEAVLQVATHNLATVKDSLETLDDESYNKSLELLEKVLAEVEKQQVKLNRARG